MRKRITIFIALTMLLMQVIAVQADSMEGDVFCGDLSNADCKILLDNAAAMDEIHSLSFSALFEFGVVGAGLDEGFLMSGSGSGRLSFDPAAAVALEDSEAHADPEALALLTEAFFSSLAGEFTFNFSGETTEEDMAMQFSMILQEGVIVVDGALLEALTGESMGDVRWLGLDTAGVFEDIFEEAGLGEESVASLAAMEDAEGEFTTIMRLPDELVGGISVAVIQSSLDLNAIMAGMTEEDLRAEARPDQMQDVEMAFALMQGIDVAEFTNRQYIGIDDHFTHRMDVALEMAMDGEALGMEGADLHITMYFDIHLSDFNESVNVAIPEDAFVLPLAMFMQMGNE